MPTLLRFAASIDKLNRDIGRALAWLLLLAVLVSATASTLRYAFSWGSNGLIELQWFLFGLTFLLCAPWTLQDKGHVRIDIIYSHLSPRGQALIDLLGGLFFLLPFCLLVGVDAWGYFGLSWQQREFSPNPGGLPWWPIKLAIPVACALLGAQGVAESLKALAVLMGYPPAVAKNHKE
ncbi:MAG: TRAP transporter small permease subunit [Pseudomonadota bacterium]